MFANIPNMVSVGSLTNLVKTSKHGNKKERHNNFHKHIDDAEHESKKEKKDNPSFTASKKTSAIQKDIPDNIIKGQGINKGPSDKTHGRLIDIIA